MNALQRLGALTAIVIAILALYGGKSLMEDLSGAVVVFEIHKVWKSWNWILTACQVVGIFCTIFFLNKLTSGKKWVFAEERKEDPEVIELWKEGDGGWSEKESRVLTKEERDDIVLQQLADKYGGKGTEDFWKTMARKYKKSQYPKASFYCVEQKKEAERRESKPQKMVEGSPSPTESFIV